MRQNRFEIDYTARLKSRIEENIPLYKGDVFPIDEDEVIVMPDVEKPNGLLEKLLVNPKNDLDNAIEVYNSFESLSPIAASQDSFWSYLTHKDLFEYVQKRWDVVMSDEANKATIREHFFGTNRNAIGELWWNVYLTIDEHREDKFELTRILYKQTDITQNLCASVALFPNKNAIHGILEFYLEHKEVLDNAINNRNRFITQSLNRWGGAKKLMYFEKEDFKNAILKNYDTIMSITSSTDYSSVEWLQ